MAIHRREDRGHLADRDERVPIPFTPGFQEHMGDLGWKTKPFVGPLPGWWHELLDPPTSASGTRWRFTVLSLMFAVAVVAVVIAGALWSLGQIPRARACRRLAMIHARSAREWTDYAQLSDKGITSILAISRGPYVLQFNHFVEPKRPTERKAAEDFDRECQKVAAICRARAAYHAQMSQKWLRGSRYPWESVLPDLPTPFPIEASDNRDSIY